MRRVRLTYGGAFHHGMNCGINGENIFERNQNKSFFLDFLEEAVLGEEMKRIEDRFFEPVEKVIWEFEQKIGNEIEDINVNSHAGKRLQEARKRRRVKRILEKRRIS